MVPSILRRAAFLFSLETLYRSPSRDLNAVNREVSAGKQRRDRAAGQGRGHHFARHVRCQQSVAVLAEHSCHPNTAIYVEANETMEQRGVLHLLHQVTLGTDLKQDLDQTSTDQPRGRDQTTAEIGIRVFKITVETGKRAPQDRLT